MSTILVGSELSYDVRQSTVLAVEDFGCAHRSPKIESRGADLYPASQRSKSWRLAWMAIAFIAPWLNRARCASRIEPTVDLQPDVILPAEVTEAAKTQIPADVLPYSNPSRY